MGTLVFAIVLGVVVGIVVGALGAGGGILAVPALTYLLHQSPHAAAMGSLLIVLATACVALPAKVRAGTVRVRQGLIFGAISVIGSFLGSRLSAYVDGTVLMSLFALMLAVMCAVMVRKGLAERKNQASLSVEREPRGLWAVSVAALATGFLTGFFGVGGGFMVVPVLTLVLAFGMRQAAGTSLLIMIMASAAGLVSRYGQNIDVEWGVVVCFMVGSMVGGVAGGPLSNRAKPYQLTLIFGALLAVVCVVTAGETVYSALS